jgi:protein MAK11
LLSADELGLAAGRPIAEDSRNRELGSLLHHGAAVTQLAFPTRGKLLSAAEDSTVGVTRTRDWALLSSVRVPIPKAVGRPSGDTAAQGAEPHGVNAFAVHPSMKLMISVSKGERAMRLWNLLTGKKAGVLNFAKEVLAQVGEGRHSTGEGRRVVWGTSGGEDEFAVAFERDILVFGMDSQPRCRVMGTQKTKVHQLVYIPLQEGGDDTLLAVSTEDGRILFFSTSADHLATSDSETSALPVAKLVAQLGGKAAGIAGRVKDFSILPVHGERSWYIVTGGSDGRLRVWCVQLAELQSKEAEKQVGKLLGVYETHNRITCLGAFIMIPRPEGEEDIDDGLVDDGLDEASDDEEE